MNDLGQAAVSADKAPRTERGRKTVRKLLEAAAQEFGAARLSRGGDHRHHQPRRRRARHLLHLFREQGGAVPGARPRHEPGHPRPCRRGGAPARPDRLAAERIGLAAFIAFTRAASRALPDHRGGAVRRRGRLSRALSDLRRRLSPNLAAAARPRRDRATGPDELRAWALIGMSVFLGMRYGIWNEDMAPAEVADRAIDLVSEGLRQEMIADLPDLIAKRAALTPGHGRARGRGDRPDA